jgi:NADH-quinone oxidoreductase subunit L
MVLSIGSIFAGFVFKDLLIGHDSAEYFWTDSIKFIIPLSTDHPPYWIIYLTPILVVLAIPISYYIFVKNKNITIWLANENKPLYNFLLNKWYFDEFYDYIFVRPSKKIGFFLWQYVDIKIIDKFGPDGISNLIKKLSDKAVKLQSGYIYQYAFIILLGFSALLTYLIVL